MIIGIDANEANQKTRVGVGQFAFNVIKELERRDKKNHYLMYLKAPPLPDLPEKRLNWDYKFFGPSKLWTQVSLPIKLFTQKERLDVFYSPSHYSPRFSLMPTVISIMDLWHHYQPEQFTKKDLYQLTFWEKYSVKKASRIVTISESTKKDLIKFYQYPADRITVAYPGFDKFEIQTSSPETNSQIEKIKKKYKISKDYLLYLGTLQPKKNLTGLVQAFNLLTSRYPDLGLVIAGKKGWLYEEIFKKVKDLRLEDRVVFTGFIEESEKPYLIAGCGCFVLPSFYEGFGIPVLEAMALGVPVAISNISSLPEVGGRAAFYFDPKDPEKIAQTIGKVLKLSPEQTKKVGESGRQQARKFSWEKCGRQVLSSLESVK